MTNQRSSTQLRIAQTIITILAMTAGTSFGSSVKTTHTYGEFTGASVTYFGVVESTSTEAPPPANVGDAVTARVVTDVLDPTVLYGQPTVNGNALIFGNPNFSSLAGTNGIDTDFTDGKLSFSLHADSSTYIEFLTLDEFGLVILTTTSESAKSGTQARVEAPAFLTVNEVMLDDGSTLELPITTLLVSELQIEEPVETVQGGGWDGNSPPMVFNEETQQMEPTSAWKGSIKFDIVEMLTNNGVTAPEGRTIMGATKVEYDMNNALHTSAELGESTAVIDKKRITVYPEISLMQVPEPATCILVAMGLVPILNRRRRN